MRQDIILGLAVSAFLHGGLFFEGKLFPSQPPVAPPPLPVIILKPFDLPREDPPPPEPATVADEPVKIQKFTPTIEDAPQSVKPVDFVQRVQPPPPEGATIDSTIREVPNERQTGLPTARVWEESMLDQAPIPRVQPPPPYPREFQQQGITGEALVDFIVDLSGNVQNAYAVHATAREFGDAAVKGVSRWKFKPGRKGAVAVNTHMQVPIKFNLDGR